MFLNNDTQVTEGWLELSGEPDRIRRYHWYGWFQTGVSGRSPSGGRRYYLERRLGWNYGRLDDPDKPEYNYVKDVDYISGAAILLSNQLWKQIRRL